MGWRDGAFVTWQGLALPALVAHCVCVCVCACVRACVRVCVRAWVRACARAPVFECVRVCVHTHIHRILCYNSSAMVPSLFVELFCLCAVTLTEWLPLETKGGNPILLRHE